MEQEHKMSCVQYIWNVSSFKREPYILIAWHFCIGIAHLFAEPHFRLCFSMFLLSCYIINKCAGCLFSIYSLDYFTHTFLINFALNTIGINWGWLRVKFQLNTNMYAVKYYYALRVQGEICSRHYFVREGWALNISLFKVTLKVNEYLNKCDCLPRA